MTSTQADRLQDMWDEIKVLHLSYLQTEECLEKLKEQDRLEVLMTKYLSFVPHERKFFHSEIPFILRRSVKGKKDFSASKAISAWSALANYAHNLLTQPWRKEFYEIQKFGGFFHHNIKSALLDWEVIFELMGYKVEKDIMILNDQEPIELEKLTRIARDSFIAQVECQIMLTIYAKVVKTYNECTWEDILFFRESHICSPEQAIQGLLNMFLQRPEDLRDTYPNTCNLYSYMPYTPFDVNHLRQTNQLPSHAPPPVMCSHNMKHSLDKPEYPVGPEYDFPNYNKHIMMQHVSPEMESIGSNVYHPYLAKPHYGYSGPPPCNDPDQLPSNYDVCTSCYGSNYIDYYNSFPYSNRSKFMGNMYSYPTPGPRPPENYYPPRSSYSGARSRSEYRRPSAYSSSNSHDVPVTKSDLENAMKAFSLDEIDKTVTDSEHSESSNKIDDCQSSSASSKTRVPSTNGVDSQPRKEHNGKKANMWGCYYCTYHNSASNLICEMCGKSKNLGNENQPLISGGRECRKCTLVNERNAANCSACGTDLTSSPTYI